MKNKLKSFCKKIHIEYVGIAPSGPYLDLKERVQDRIEKGYITGMEENDIRRRIDSKLTMEDTASIVVCLFPYFVGYKEESNLSIYTHGKDYHIIIKEKLEQIGNYLSKEIEDFHYKAFTDTGALVDRHLAYLAGLGYFGLNQNIITDKYGSFVFIGYLLTNYPFEIDKPLNKTCIKCKKCIEKCPGGALLDDFQMDPRKCLSFITQKKDALSLDEQNKMKDCNTVFGCDICQRVCPHNKGVEYSNLEEFKKDLISSLEEEEIFNMSNKAFKRIYGDRAFSWRGRKIIARNLSYLKGEK
ncbi:tRNA epoxyqueuosine(34) reductase QueG [Lutibacter sp. B2]|nr:tRNA epoxyqueuosine(34) reductase QueG [Lutibacter sp. B2]